ncbi:MAG: DUF547 domain-containing protein, partial [bacterium]|nr:DUF547 domain-containing protein [bacterium]
MKPLFLMQFARLSATHLKSSPVLSLILTLALLLTSACGNAQQPRQSAQEPQPDEVSANVATDDYAMALTQFVDKDGMVNYRGLKADRAALDRFVASLGSLDAAVYESWSDDFKIAFWINAYNALTLRVIIDHYPIKGGGLLSG